MNIQIEALPDREVKLIVDVDQAQLDSKMREAARQEGKHLNIPGFRRGRAPYKQVLRAVGAERLMERALERMVPQLLADAIKEAEIEPYDLNAIESDLLSVEPLQLQFVVPLNPHVVLGDFSGLSVPAEDAMVDEAEVEETIETLRRQHAETVAVAGAAQVGDMVTYDRVGYLMDGSTVDEQSDLQSRLISEEDWEAMADAEDELDDEASADETERGDEEHEPWPPQQIDVALLGMMPNQVKEVPVVYPVSWHDKALAERTVLYRLTVTGIARSVLPEVNDDFVRRVVEDLDSVEALRDRIRTNFQMRADGREHDRRIEAIIDAIADMSEVEYPDAAVRNLVYFQINNIAKNLQPYGITLNRYMEITGQTLEDLEDAYWEEAEQGLVRSLIVRQYIEDYKVEATEAEIRRALADLHLKHGHEDVGVDDPNYIQSHYHQAVERVVSRKALSELYERVTGEPSPFREEIDEEAASKHAAAPTMDDAPIIALAPYDQGQPSSDVVAEAAPSEDETMAEGDAERAT